MTTTLLRLTLLTILILWHPAAEAHDLGPDRLGRRDRLATLAAESSPTGAWWVLFRDKGIGTETALSASLQRLAFEPRAAQRRVRAGVGADACDLPVLPRYVTGVAALGVRVRTVSR